MQVDPGDYFSDFYQPSPEVPEVPSFNDVALEVPAHLDVLPDGQDCLVVGDVAGLAELNHQQGDNPFGFKQDCGLVSVQSVLNQFGIPVSEADVVEHAIVYGRCEVSPNVSDSGGATLDDQIRVLADFGVPAHEVRHPTLQDLAKDIEGGHAVIIAANAGVLWNDPAYYDSGGANHAVCATGVARDPASGEIQGFYINDSGTGMSGQFVDAMSMNVGWLDAGGKAVVTDLTRHSAPLVATASLT